MTAKIPVSSEYKAIFQQHVHALMDEIMFKHEDHFSISAYAKHFALQNIVNNWELSAEELSTYLEDAEAMRYMSIYQDFCLHLEISIEKQMQLTFSSSSQLDLLEQFLKNYYAQIYQIMARNEIYLSAAGRHSNVCIVGIGSMPLSMLFMNRFSSARITGMDLDQEAITAAEQCVEIFTAKKPNRYIRQSLRLKHCDGASFDYQDFDVIILSMHIHNKERVLQRILASNQNIENLLIIDRQAHGLAQYFYKNNPANEKTALLSPMQQLKSGVVTSVSFRVNQGDRLN